MPEYLEKSALIDNISDEIVEYILTDTNADQIIINIANCFKSYIAMQSGITDVQPVKRGEWEEVTGYCGWGDTYYRCSICGEEWVFTDGNPKSNGWRFCPYCGARMDGQEVEENA